MNQSIGQGQIPNMYCVAICNQFLRWYLSVQMTLKLQLREYTEYAQSRRLRGLKRPFEGDQNVCHFRNHSTSSIVCI